MANSKIRWNGTTDDGRVTTVAWGDNPYTWDDVSLAIEVAEIIDDTDGKGTHSRREREAKLHQLDDDTKKRLIHLICRVKGEVVYDEEKTVGDIQIKLKDAELVIKEVLGKMRVENTNVL